MKALILASFLIVSALSSSSFLSVPTANPTSLKDSSSLIDFVFGFYIGSNLEFHVPTLMNCALDAGQVVTQLNDTYNAIVDGLANQDPNEIGGAVVSLSQFLNDTLVYCGDVLLNGSSVLAEIINDVNNITFLELAVERIGANLPTVLTDLQAVWDGIFNTGNYQSAGIALGGLVQIFFNISTNSQPINLLSLGSVNWPYTNCGSSSDDLEVSGVTLDSQPSKGVSAGINIEGTMNNVVTLKQVQITTTLNGTPLNTQYDPNTTSFQAGDPLNYRFAVTIPGFAPSGKYAVSLTFQDANNGSHGCVQVSFTL